LILTSPSAPLLHPMSNRACSTWGTRQSKWSKAKPMSRRKTCPWWTGQSMHRNLQRSETNAQSEHIEIYCRGRQSSFSPYCLSSRSNKGSALTCRSLEHRMKYFIK
jgi:hypothetical protein